VFDVPDRVIDNSYFTDFMDTSDQWIRERTGIEERRFAKPGEGPSD
jgi:3-oxoacyl-[acyl-carrier-protein] synthase-3